jgi:hypothetical protein
MKSGSQIQGFLTSYACDSSEVFVGDTLVGGRVFGARNFDPDLGLDYTLVQPISDYWSKNDSKSVLFHLNKYEYPQLPEQMLDILLPLTVSTKPPVVGVNVCVFGGEDQKMTCGAIVDFDATIQVPKPGTNGKKFVDFKKVVEVEMMDEYGLGYNGAPVYIPARIPFATEIIAAPVGQVVETIGQYRGTAYHKKT